MIIWNYFECSDRETVQFRCKHPLQSHAGLPGVFALTAIVDFNIEPLHFEAANDLACIDGALLSQHPKFAECEEFGKVGVSVIVIPYSSANYRKQLADKLNLYNGLSTEAA